MDTCPQSGGQTAVTRNNQHQAALATNAGQLNPESQAFRCIIMAEDDPGFAGRQVLRCAQRISQTHLVCEQPETWQPVCRGATAPSQ
jgi:hypothetical protein